MKKNYPKKGQLFKLNHDLVFRHRYGDKFILKDSIVMLIDITVSKTIKNKHIFHLLFDELLYRTESLSVSDWYTRFTYLKTIGKS